METQLHGESIVNSRPDMRRHLDQDSNPLRIVSLPPVPDSLIASMSSPEARLFQHMISRNQVPEEFKSLAPRDVLRRMGVTSDEIIERDRAAERAAQAEAKLKYEQQVGRAKVLGRIHDALSLSLECAITFAPAVVAWLSSASIPKNAHPLAVVAVAAWTAICFAKLNVDLPFWRPADLRKKIDS